LPLGGPETQSLRLRNFYPGDLALYSDFEHPKGWERSAVRQFIEKQFKKLSAIQPVIGRDPLISASNHAAFFMQLWGQTAPLSHAVPDKILTLTPMRISIDSHYCLFTTQPAMT
jgi:hypothetical protein